MKSFIQFINEATPTTKIQDKMKNVQTGQKFEIEETIKDNDGKYKTNKVTATVVGFTDRLTNSTKVKYKRNPHKKVGENYSVILKTPNQTITVDLETAYRILKL